MFLRKMELETKLQLLQVTRLLRSPAVGRGGGWGFAANGDGGVATGLGVLGGGGHPCVPSHCP